MATAVNPGRQGMGPDRFRSIEPEVPASAGYYEWSLEELRTLALQLQLPDAARKSRHELLDLLAGDVLAHAFPRFGKPWACRETALASPIGDTK